MVLQETWLKTGTVRDNITMGSGSYTEEEIIEAAKKGHAGGQGNLGYCYQNGLGVKQNIKKAIKYYKLAVKQGNSHAQLNLAICYFNGQGVKIDQDEAFRLLRLSAEQGNELAIRNLKRFGMM